MQLYDNQRVAVGTRCQILPARAYKIQIYSHMLGSYFGAIW